MALIKCPECGKEISDKAKNCIHCGYPLDSINSENISDAPANTDEILDKTVHINTCTESISQTTTTETKDSNPKDFFNRYKKPIIACLVGVVAITLLIVFLTKPQPSLEEDGSPTNNTQTEINKPKKLTREEILNNLGEVLTVSFDEMVKYIDVLQESKFYIEGKIEEAKYDSFNKYYRYELDAGLFDTITIHDSQKFEEGDYVYVTVKGLSDYNDEFDTIQISKSKSNQTYLGAEDYFEMCEKRAKTRFKVTGYILDSHTNTLYASIYYGKTIYYMWESENAYELDKSRSNCIAIVFSDDQTNIIGKKIQVIGNLNWDGKLTGASIVSN